MHEGVPVNEGRPEGASYSRTPGTEEEKEKKGGSIPSPFAWRAAGVATKQSGARSCPTTLGKTDHLDEALLGEGIVARDVCQRARGDVQQDRD
ncbi:hypothetical protein THAOC_29619 [Thalassiosira oceanica]|uniref:Uncharacterized protein n=1 Tax=Thalassiosira oceanica TaxID=159749 RepID=K0RX03_THAOC|nr:hypothetical protein THAOC_29619 [Thalassiosira oceanica]|eukprot:EJK51227.1 hypothetical protein THAOC_29619 [Thalassiosira oceanica]